MHCRLGKDILRRFVRYATSNAPSREPVLVECLPSRSILRIAGSNVAEYLQGLVTNDMNHIDRGSPSLFTMFLNSKGRVLFDAIIYKGREKDTFLIECDHEAANDLKAHLNIYKVRRKISVDSLENDVNVWNVNSSEAVFNEANVSLNKKSLAEQISCLSEFTGSSDPRVSELGWRVIIPKECYLVTAFRHRGINVIEGLNYKALRYRLGVAEGITELPPGSCFPLEANCDYLHGVSFHKGCYIGQELTARTYHTGVVRKRLMPLLFESNPSLPNDSIIKATTDEKSLGKLRGVTGRIGIGLLRVAEVLKAEQLETCGIKLKTFWPYWWPAEAPKNPQNAI